MPDEITDEAVKPEFKAITSQDELNRVLHDRLERERAKFADYDAFKEKAAEYDKAQDAAKSELQKLAERAEAAEKRIAEYEQRDQRAEWAREAAKEVGVSADVLRGTTKDEFLEHARSIKALTEQQASPPPRRTSVPPGKSSSEGESRAVAALRALRAQ